jgi:hypothetical protein
VPRLNPFPFISPLTFSSFPSTMSHQKNVKEQRGVESLLHNHGKDVAGLNDFAVGGAVSFLGGKGMVTGIVIKKFTHSSQGGMGRPTEESPEYEVAIDGGRDTIILSGAALRRKV